MFILTRSILQPAITPEQIVELVSGLYSEKGDPTTPEGQSRYMKDRFPYYDLKAQQWMAIIREVFQKQGKYGGAELYKFVRLCFEEECREMHYTGLQMLEKRIS